MRRSWLLLLCFVAWTAAQAAAPAPLVVPPLEFRERVLANGLRVVTLEDHASPTVSVQMWYEVGGKDDPPGRSGFAHLFEHLMFKSTRYLKPEQFDRMTEDVGGQNNAGTGDDSTDYYNVVPSNHLERLLWAEAERLSNLNVDEASFRSERAVVQEEYRERVLASPYGRFYEAFAPRSYAVHPYRRGVIGNIDELNAASLDDVRAFHRTYYRPDNAILIVTGDFDPKELDAWIDKYFGPIPRPATPIPRVTTVEPPRTRDARLSRNGSQRAAARGRAHVARAAGAQSRRGGAHGRRGAARQRRVVAAQPGARVSRADRADGVVRAPTCASTPACSSRTRSRRPVPRRTRSRVRCARRSTSWRSAPVPAAELAKVKTQLVTQALVERQTPLGKGMALGEAIIARGDARRANDELAELQAVTPADVQRVVRKYLTGAPQVTIEYTQQAAAKDGAGRANAAIPAGGAK